MTAIVALGGYRDTAELEERAARMLRAVTDVQTSDAQVIHLPASLLASRHPPWHSEVRHAASGASSPASPVAVVCDASLFYLSDLAAKLGVSSAAIHDMRAADIVALAYAKYGAELVQHLEGDYVFVLRDPRRGMFLAGRDIGGRRTLYYSVVRGRFVAASTVGAVLAHGDVPARLNLPFVAATAAALWPSGSETCYLDISELPAGHLLEWKDGDTSPLLGNFWHPPPERSGRASPTLEASRELLSLLKASVDQRVPAGAGAAVSLSGGWDSSAVFASSNAMLRESPANGRNVIPISMSYPVGDSGREDELIASAASYWGAEPRWIQGYAHEMLGIMNGAASRDQPWVHPFEAWNRGILREARLAGARVLLDGSGGDQLFQVSDIYVADLVKSGRLIEALVQWRARVPTGSGLHLRDFFKWGVITNIPSPIRGALERFRGRPFASHVDRKIPWFIDGDFAAREGLHERAAAFRVPLESHSATRREMEFFVRCPWFWRVALRTCSILQ